VLFPNFISGLKLNCEEDKAETSKTWKNSENLMYVGATKAEYFTEIRKIVPDSLACSRVGAQGGSLSEVVNTE
jgi:hypothetical protein